MCLNKYLLYLVSNLSQMVFILKKDMCKLDPSVEFMYSKMLQKVRISLIEAEHNSVNQINTDERSTNRD